MAHRQNPFDQRPFRQAGGAEYPALATRDDQGPLLTDLLPGMSWSRLRAGLQQTILQPPHTLDSLTTSPGEPGVSPPRHSDPTDYRVLQSTDYLIPSLSPSSDLPPAPELLAIKGVPLAAPPAAHPGLVVCPLCPEPGLVPQANIRHAEVQHRCKPTVT